jgi:serine/threonine-protein kinase
MGIMDDDLTATMPDGHLPRASAPTDCETLFRDEGEHTWMSLGEERVCEGLWGLLRRRQDEPSCRDDGRDASAPGHRYLIGRQIGRGGMGVVFEGWDAQLQRSVAIKLMDRKQEARPVGLLWFFREARLASQLRHPSIVAIHEFDLTDQGQPFIVMQLLTGQTLKHILSLRQDTVAELPGLLATFLQVCQAVASAHGAGVIHRDLKPSNIMVGRFGVVTVMDWGMAQVLGGGSDNAVAPTEDELPRISVKTAGETEIHRTVAGTVCGTPAYLAPEQARGEVARVDRRSDVFGLGAILCEILTGSPPFSAATSDASWAKAAAGDVADAFARLDACDGPLPLVRLAKHCLAADPAARPDDAAAIVAGLTDYLESGQRRAEQELVRFFDLSLDLFCIAGLNGFFRQINENFPRLLGYSIDELKSRQFMDFVHPDDQEKTTNEIARLARGESTIQFVNRYRHADGSYIWLEWNARSVAEEAAIYAVARDVTERVAAVEARRRLEESLDRSRQELVDFTENANVPMHWVDAEGRIAWANQAELDFLGYTRREYLGSPITRYHADVDVIADILARLKHGECLVGREARLVARDGSIKHVAIHSSAYAEGDRFGHSRCFTIDISHQKQIEDLSQERATLAAFTAASALYLTAEGGLHKRLHDVASEAVSQLDIAAVQIWGWDGRLSRLQLLTSAGVEVAPDESSGGIAAGAGLIGGVALTKQPRHVLDTHDAWRDFEPGHMLRRGITSFVGYPLLVADGLVGVLAVYSERPISELLITALSSVVASMALAIRLDRQEG